MGILDSFGKQLSGTFDSLREKNHRSAVINRLRIVIKNERENSARAYVALGKYYYEHLRAQGNAETEALCASIDDSDRRLKRAFAHLEEIREQTIAQVPETECADCSDDCSACKFQDNCGNTEAAPAETESTETPKEPSEPIPSAPLAAPIPPEPAVTPAEEEAAPEEPEA
ncbi:MULTISPECIES: hypothetical protein [Caproicibacterium]|uniref:Uncharacterized protein n=1 Tax=Caproicibacterium argilliputei TaxID=3030016 RepID=A0AA97D8D5_9FIRM|nr:hypothetical protein [Caproicibacterium argilliputei]WOC32209.1 hypothetical protein PXC00_13635 [Caproicibacterium argilliputei]